jgi:hypothetical protein
MTRTGADGTITVYRGVPANVSPRWGCPPTTYLDRPGPRLTTGAQEVYGVDVSLAAAGWSMSNGLVNVLWSASGSLDVQAYTGGAYHSKPWAVFATSGTSDRRRGTGRRCSATTRMPRSSASPRACQPRPSHRRPHAAPRRPVRRGLHAAQHQRRRSLLSQARHRGDQRDRARVVRVRHRDRQRLRRQPVRRRQRAGVHRPCQRRRGIKANTTMLDFWLGVVAGGGSSGRPGTRSPTYGTSTSPACLKPSTECGGNGWLSRRS